MYFACGKDVNFCDQRADQGQLVFSKDSDHNISHLTCPSHNVILIFLSSSGTVFSPLV